MAIKKKSKNNMKVMIINVNSYNFFCENKMKKTKISTQILDSANFE